jgi:thioredoxin 2
MNALAVHGVQRDKLVLPCLACGGAHPTAIEDLARARRCPGCGSEQGAVAAPLDVDAAGVLAVVSRAPVPVLVDFWAPWCPPCLLAGPLVKKVAADMAGKALVLKVDTDQSADLATELGVQAIPTFMVFKEREVVQRKSGLSTPATMKRWLAAA